MTKPKYKYPSNRPSFADLKKTKVSMLGGTLPVEYSTFDAGYDIRDHLTRNIPDERVARLTIVWDIPFDALDEVDEAMDKMRERGAALVTDVEEVKAS